MVFSAPSVSTIVGIPALILLLAHVKSLPLAYTIRVWLLVRAATKRAKANNMKPEPIFTVTREDHKCLYDDVDFNFHMNNGMYNKVLDFSRVHLLFTLFPRVMIESTHGIVCHNAGVVTLFKKEIPPLSTYQVQTRILTWNAKWLWLQHRFMLPSGDIACVSVSKLVFKKSNGKTIPPAQLFELCGHSLSDPAIEERRQANWDLVEGILRLDALNNDTYDWNSPQSLPAAKL
ncbi:hypothetical protein BX666DRAFT_2022765 [Dichotomocladium elegans]|nr:hypothetical protein BX666DRAFT_2022765 [Dichotomocladium elegans]